MRIGELRGLSSLPIPLLRDQFRNEEVLTVLPVRDAATSRETLFVATRTKLAVLTVLPMPHGHWVTRWAPWDSVSVAELAGPPVQDVDVYELGIRVSGQLFHARLRGEAGRIAIRDLVAAIRTSQATHPARP